MDSDPGCHGFGVSKEGGKAEGELLQIFSLDVAEGRLRSTDTRSWITDSIRTQTGPEFCVGDHVQVKQSTDVHYRTQVRNLEA